MPIDQEKGGIMLAARPEGQDTPHFRSATPVSPRRSLFPSSSDEMLHSFGGLPQIERDAHDHSQFLSVPQASAQTGFWRATLDPLAFSLSEETCALYNLPFQPSFTHDEIAACVHPGDLPRARAIFSRSLVTGCLYVEFRIRRGEGPARWLATRARLFSDPGGLPVLVGVTYDISSLKVTEERYQLAARAIREGLWDWDLRTSTVYYSPRWQRIAGFDEIELCDTLQHWLGRIHESDRPRVESDLNAHLHATSSCFLSERRLRHADGTWRWVEVHGIAERDPDGQPLRMAGSLSDITSRKMSDPLTGLANRLLILDHLERRIERGHRDNAWNFAVLSVHVDRFKLVNDTLGYSGGDALLIEVGQRLTTTVAASRITGHTIARVGGGDFLVFLDNIAREEQVFATARILQTTLSVPFLHHGSTFAISTSIGVVRPGPHYLHPEELIRDADTAMHQARAGGPARSVTFNSSMREKAVHRFQLEAELRHAIESGELLLHYQPEVDLQTNRVVGFEALVRWRHPQRGVLLPGEFIPIAEESGLILPLGDWGLGAACQQILAWSRLTPHSPPPRVSVNLSAKQFARPGLVEQVGSILESTGVLPSLLCLEVTESSLMGDADAALETMRGLRTLGIGLHMDDFGTGYSSLQYLHRYPFDTLKIDRSFISRLCENKESSEIVRTILSLAQSLGMTVVAEGIETEDQLSCLQALGCGYGQGFYFSRPLDAASIQTLLSSEDARLRPTPSSTRVPPDRLQ